jgi:hypothetical protein
MRVAGSVGRGTKGGQTAEKRLAWDTLGIRWQAYQDNPDDVEMRIRFNDALRDASLSLDSNELKAAIDQFNIEPKYTKEVENTLTLYGNLSETLFSKEEQRDKIAAYYKSLLAESKKYNMGNVPDAEYIIGFLNQTLPRGLEGLRSLFNAIPKAIKDERALVELYDELQLGEYAKYPNIHRFFLNIISDLSTDEDIKTDPETALNALRDKYESQREARERGDWDTLLGKIGKLAGVPALQYGTQRAGQDIGKLLEQVRMRSTFNQPTVKQGTSMGEFQNQLRSMIVGPQLRDENLDYLYLTNQAPAPSDIIIQNMLGQFPEYSPYTLTPEEVGRFDVPDIEAMFSKSRYTQPSDARTLLEKALAGGR